MWIRLTDPIKAEDEEHFRMARLLNRILIPLIVMGLIIQTEYMLLMGEANRTEVVVFAAIFLLAVAFGLSRYGKFKQAVFLTLACILISIFFYVILSPPQFNAIGVFYYLIIPFLIAEVFLDSRTYLFVSALIIVGVSMLGFLGFGTEILDLILFCVTFIIVVWLIGQARHQLAAERQASLSESEANLAALIENSPDRIWSVDRSWHLIVGNKQFLVNYYQTMGYKPRKGEALLRESTPDEILSEWSGYYTRVLAGERFVQETKFHDTDGLRYYEYRFNPIYSPDGLVTGGTIMARDITERKQAELALHEANELLEQRVAERTAELMQASRAKDEFLASMSHELRTPLNGILGLSESLMIGTYGNLQPRQGEVLRMITESGEHLLELINDILDLSKIEAGKLSLQLESIKVNGLCQAALRMIKEPAAQKRLKVSLSIENGVGAVYADSRRVKQMIVNLLGNAVKFTPDGGQIGLDVARDGYDAVRFTVWDTGIGIPVDKLPDLFKSFVQLDSSLSRQYSGTGLGLALVRSLAELHGGSVGAESELEKGSRFFFSIPQQMPLEATDSPASPALPVTNGITTCGLYGQKILLVEDNEINLMVTSDFLENYGCHVIKAENGIEALQSARESKPDLVLMDIQMPGMDGLNAIRSLRETPAFDSVPIIALTALTMPGDRERCLEAGASEYLSKPVSLKELKQTIERLLML